VIIIPREGKGKFRKGERRGRKVKRREEKRKEKKGVEPNPLYSHFRLRHKSA